MAQQWLVGTILMGSATYLHWMDMWHTFNMGVGFCLVVKAETVGAVLTSCSEQGYAAWQLGRVALGENKNGPIVGLPS